MYVTTAKCPDGTYYGAAWRTDNTLIAMSEVLPTRSKARGWARRILRNPFLRAWPLDPRDPDPAKPGIFRDHNCWKCHDGAQPCVRGNPRQCDYLHARND